MLFSGPVVFMGGELRGIPQREYQRDMCMWYLVKDKMGGHGQPSVLTVTSVYTDTDICIDDRQFAWYPRVHDGS